MQDTFTNIDALRLELTKLETAHKAELDRQMAKLMPDTAASTLKKLQKQVPYCNTPKFTSQFNRLAYPQPRWWDYLTGEAQAQIKSWEKKFAQLRSDLAAIIDGMPQRPAAFAALDDHDQSIATVEQDILQLEARQRLRTAS